MTAESGQRAMYHHIPVPASMGPRSHDRGIACTEDAGQVPAELLQWGRGRMTAESWHRVARMARGTSFNGAAVA